MSLGNMKSVLVIEDNEAYQHEALADLGKMPQVLSTRLAQNYGDAKAMLQKHQFDAVLTDLYFPSGNISIREDQAQRQSIGRLMENYFTEHEEHLFPKKERGVVYRALAQAGLWLGFADPKDYVASDIWKKLHPPGSEIDLAVHDEINMRKNSAMYDRCQKWLGGINDGTQLLP